MNINVEEGKFYYISRTTDMAKSALMRDREYVMNGFPREQYGRTTRHPAIIAKRFVEDYEDDVVLVLEIMNPNAKFYSSIEIVKVMEYNGHYHLNFFNMVDSVLVPYDGSTLTPTAEELQEVKFWKNAIMRRTPTTLRQRIHMEILLAIEWSSEYKRRAINVLYRDGCYLPESMMEKYGRGI